MPSAGQLIRASDVRRYIGSNSRTTALGSAVTTETTIAIDVAFTLTATRRIQCNVFANVVITGANFGFVLLRRNATGSAVAPTDTGCVVATPIGAVTYASFSFEEILAAGTYAYGVLIDKGGATNNNLDAVGAPFKAAALDVWDMGDS